MSRKAFQTAQISLFNRFQDGPAYGIQCSWLRSVLHFVVHSSIHVKLWHPAFLIEIMIAVNANWRCCTTTCYTASVQICRNWTIWGTCFGGNATKIVMKPSKKCWWNGVTRCAFCIRVRQAHWHLQCCFMKNDCFSTSFRFRKNKTVVYIRNWTTENEYCVRWRHSNIQQTRREGEYMFEE